MHRGSPVIVKHSFVWKLSNVQEFEYMWPLISDMDLEIWHEISRSYLTKTAVTYIQKFICYSTFLQTNVSQLQSFLDEYACNTDYCIWSAIHSAVYICIQQSVSYWQAGVPFTLLYTHVYTLLYSAVYICIHSFVVLTGCIHMYAYVLTGLYTYVLTGWYTYVLTGVIAIDPSY